MTTTPRKFDSEIRINSSGKWFFRGQEITQENVLEFFKRNIQEDSLGIYITNSYAELIEHGYLESKSIFLNILNSTVRDDTIYFLTEDGKETSIKDFLFYFDEEEKIFCMRKTEQFIKFRFNRQMHSFISNLIVEENENYFIQLEKEKIPILPFHKPLEVSIPSDFIKQ